jgi:hypothetical protein
MFMRKMALGMVVLVGVIWVAAAVFGQTNLTVVRHADNTIWAMTCDGTEDCSAWTQIGGKFSVQPTLTWDPAIQKYILIGIGANLTSIWRSTFDADGTWNNDWALIGTGATGSPSPVAVAAGGGTNIPVGAVIDWWRPDATFAVPTGFAICDGSIVNDAGSPLNGKTLPDLTNKFIMGVTNVNNIGTAGGSSGHAHSVDINHDHGAVNSSSAGPFTGNTEWVNNHNHAWILEQNNGDWLSWRGDGSVDIMHIWDNGIDNSGEGFYPIGTAGSNLAWYTEPQGEHLHQFSVASHVHGVDLPATGVLNKGTTTVSNVPPYYGCIFVPEIVKIKNYLTVKACRC